MSRPIAAAGIWFLVLTGVCIVAPYLSGVRPRTRRDWTAIAITIAFLIWILLLMVPVRSAE